MSEPQIHESVIKADRWAKIIALVAAIAFFLFADALTEESLFAMVTAAFAAIGVRFLIPYYASARVEDPDAGGIHDHPATGDYHHGAIAVALLLGATVMTGVKALDFHSWIAFIVGGLCIAGAYLVFREKLPMA